MRPSLCGRRVYADFLGIIITRTKGTGALHGDAGAFVLVLFSLLH
jgi:hypothetical protein